LTYAVGVFNDEEGLSDLLKSDPNLCVLRRAMEEKPISPWVNINHMPMGFYTMIYNSKQLVDILRAHTPAELEGELHQKTILNLFEEAILVLTNHSCIASDDGNNKIAYSC
jgi:hypothetical protein